jgi:4-hydroxy-3-methylbut-2-enyl diphosphate reductase
VDRERLTAVDVAPGEIVVASEFAHPRRGPVRCPAAPLVREGLRGSGRRVRSGRVHVPSPGPGQDTGEAVFFMVSYVDPAGHVVGFGAAVRADDPEGCAAAQTAVDAWSGILRTRRALLAAAPTCGDGTCPAAARAAVKVREYADRGDTVVLIGRRGQVATDLLNRAPAATVLVESELHVDGLTGIDPDRLSFVVPPGLPVEQAGEVLAALRARFPRLRGQHPDELCYAASDRREALRSVATASDLLLVCGDPDSPEIEELAGWSTSLGRRTRRISTLGELRPEWLASAATVGVAGGSPGRPGVAGDVVEVLSGLGPLSVVHRRVTTDVIGVPGLNSWHAGTHLMAVER